MFDNLKIMIGLVALAVMVLVVSVCFCVVGVFDPEIIND